MGRLSKKLEGKTTKLARPGANNLPNPPSRTGRFLEIDPNRIEPNPEQPRREFDQAKLERLADSVAEHGVLQPLLVRVEPDGRVILIAGERRLRAAKAAGLATVPCTARNGDMAVLALIENLDREDLTPLEEAHAYAKLQESHGLSLDDLAATVGKAKSTVSEILKLAELPAEVLPVINHNPSRFPKRFLVELGKEKDPERVQEAVKKVAMGQAEPDKVRSQLRQDRAEAKQKDKPKPRKESRRAEGPKPSDKAAAEADRLAASLAALDLPSLNYRQRGVLREALKTLAKAAAPIFHHLKQAAIKDRDKLTPEDRAWALAELRTGLPKKNTGYILRTFAAQGKKMDTVEFADQHRLALQEERARQAGGGE